MSFSNFLLKQRVVSSFDEKCESGEIYASRENQEDTYVFCSLQSFYPRRKWRQRSRSLVLILPKGDWG